MDYNSNLVLKLHRHRGIYSGKPYQVAGRVKLADGATLAAADRLLMVPVGENQSVKRVTVEVRGDLGAAAGSVGYFQMLEEDGVTPVRVQRIGPRGSEYGVPDFVSPPDDPDAYRAAAALAGYTETIVPTPIVLAGPVYVGIAITTGGTVTGDSEIHLGVEFDGETSQRDVMGDANPDNDYLLG